MKLVVAYMGQVYCFLFCRIQEPKMSVASSEQDDQPVQGKLSASWGFLYDEHAFPYWPVLSAFDHLRSSNFCLKANPDPGIKFKGSQGSHGEPWTPTMEAWRIRMKPWLRINITLIRSRIRFRISQKGRIRIRMKMIRRIRYWIRINTAFFYSFF